MTKVVLEDTASGYAISTINNNFETIEDELNVKVLYRDNPTGEPNQMGNLLDMNTHRIINLGAPVAPNDAARLADIPFDPIPIGTTTALLTTVTPFSTIAATNAQGALEEIVSDLSSTASLTQGAGTVGFLYSLNYVGNTVGRWLKDLATSAGSTFIGWIQAGTGAVLRTISAKLRDKVTFEDYGAVGDGSTDDTVAMNAALATGYNVKAADTRKTYRITGPLVMNSTSQVVDFNFCTIELNDATGLLSNLTVGDNVTQLNGCKIRNAVFTRTQAATAGAAIYARYIGDTWIENCRIFGNSRIYRGIDLNRGVRIRVTGNFFQQTVSNGILVQGTGTGANRAVDIEVLNNRFDTLGSSGLNCFDFTEGIFCRGNIFYACTSSSVTVNASTNTNGLVSFKFVDNDFDTTIGVGMYIQNVNNITINNNWFSNNTGVNLQIEDAVDSVVISGNQLYGSTAKSIQLSADNTVITGNLISGGDDGIFVRSTASVAQITGNVISGMSGYGINLLETPITVQVGPNLFSSNTTGNVSSGAVVPTIASATNMTLLGNSDTYNISGTTNIATILGGWEGRTVRLLFTGALTITNATGVFASVRLSGGANFTTAANSGLSLTHNGTQWYETGRAA